MVDTACLSTSRQAIICPHGSSCKVTNNCESRKFLLGNDTLKKLSWTSFLPRDSSCRRNIWWATESNVLIWYSFTAHVGGGGSLVTTSWRVLRLQMEGRPTSSRGKPTRGGPPAWGLGVGLTALNHKKFIFTKCFKVPRTWLRIGSNGRLLWTR
jgi:hypothetical protein